MRLDPAPPAADHLPALDGVRGVALLAVLAFHFIGHGPGASAWPAWVRTPALFGWAGVDLFFVLSGFLITRILLASRDTRGELRVFYGRRALRIFPIYYAILAVLTGALVATGLRTGEGWHLSALWLYLTNFDIARHGFSAAIFRSVQFAHLWTLAIEEQFYLVWPCVMLFAPRRALLPVCGGVIVGAFAARLALLHAGGDPTAVYVLTYCRADALAWGAVVALVMATRPATFVRRAGLVLFIVGGVVTATIVVAGESVDEYGRLMQTIGYSAIAAAAAGAIAWIAAPVAGLVRRSLSHPAIRAIGRTSYGAYLFHVPLRGVASAIWRNGLHRDPANLSLIETAFTTLMLVAATLGLAALSFRFIERPFLKLKPRLH